jgi:Spy/CpxP family protein refolding chaperone
VDAFTVAAELLGDLQLTSSQLAQLRAINHKYWQAVFALLHPRDDDAQRAALPVERATPAAEPSLTARQTADLRAMLDREVRALLTPQQRAELDRNRSR